MIEKIDITPGLNILKTFKNIQYSVSAAISELIDNATQSYKDYKVKNIKPQIFIMYYRDEKKLMLIDNCFGIRPSKIDDVLKLNVPNKITHSRNEFGMGLKTSAFWFGNILRINSKFIEENKTINLEINLNNLEKYENNSIIINHSPEDYFEKYNFEYGTEICIEEMHHKIKKDTLQNLSKKLSSKYRDDIDHDDLEIRIILIEKGVMIDCSTDKYKEILNPYDAEPLKYEWPKLAFSQKGDELKIYIDDKITFENESYNIKGWIGIVESGSRKLPGLTLIRNGRTIRGDDEDNYYKPKKIFKDQGSFEWQRIIGYLDLSDFPVNQTKTDFNWSDGLEETFINYLFDKLKSHNEFDFYREVKRSKQKKELFRDDFVNKKICNELKERFEDNSNTLKLSNICINKTNNKDGNIEITIKDDSYKTYNEIKEFVFEIDIITNNRDEKWLSIEPKDDNYYLLKINWGLDFFAPFNFEKNMRDYFIHFFVYIAYSIIRHKNHICDNAFEIQNILNELLKNKE